jgi:DNA-directed RNA polymerase subunit RPC12/RpoP
MSDDQAAWGHKRIECMHCGYEVLISSGPNFIPEDCFYSCPECSSDISKKGPDPMDEAKEASEEEISLLWVPRPSKLN